MNVYTTITWNGLRIHARAWEEPDDDAGPLAISDIEVESVESRLGDVWVPLPQAVADALNMCDEVQDVLADDAGWGSDE